MLKCEKTGAHIYIGWMNGYTITDLLRTDDDVAIMQIGTVFQNPLRNYLTMWLISHEKLYYLSGTKTLIICNPGDYVYYGYEGKTLKEVLSD